MIERESLKMKEKEKSGLKTRDDAVFHASQTDDGD
jgi:hypothetical protein